MSGGHFGYQQGNILGIAAQLDALIKDNKTATGCWYSSEAIEEFKTAAMLLRKAYVYADNIDWFVSGDTSEQQLHEFIENDLSDLQPIGEQQ